MIYLLLWLSTELLMTVLFYCMCRGILTACVYVNHTYALSSHRSKEGDESHGIPGTYSPELPDGCYKSNLEEQHALTTSPPLHPLHFYFDFLRLVSQIRSASLLFCATLHWNISMHCFIGCSFEGMASISSSSSTNVYNHSLKPFVISFTTLSSGAIMKQWITFLYFINFIY